MEDVSNEELIELLYAVEDDLPAAAIVKDDRGPNVIVNTGNPEDTVQAQLEMIAGHMTWLADHTEADIETVAQDALSVAQDMRDAPGFFARSEDIQE